MAGIGIPMSTIKDAFGHPSIKVTERYVNTPREGLRWAMDQVDAALFGTAANSAIVFLVTRRPRQMP